MSTYTPGPWKVTESLRGYSITYLVRGTGIPHKVASVSKLYDNANANARLIAQAPAMLEASEGLIKAFYAPDYDRRGEMIASAVRQLQALLAQIEGTP